MATDREVFNRYGVEYNPNGYGYGGVGGIKHKDVVGWNNVTVGLAASVMNDTIMMNGAMSHDPNTIPLLEPIRAGRFIVKWLKVPPFFDPIVVSYLTFFLEKCVRGVEGIPDNQISTVSSANIGTVQRELDFPGIYKEGGKSVTLNTLTCTGDGLGKLLKYWLYGMSDRETGVAHMYGKNLRFHRSNYSGSLIYIFLGPTCRPEDIEFSCLWNEVYPTASDNDSKFNNSQIGEVGSLSEQSVEFSGIYLVSPVVDILAQYIVAASGLYGQSQFDTVLPNYMYDLFLGSSTSDEDLKRSMNLNLRTRINQVINDPVAKNYTSYTEQTIAKHDEVNELKGTSNNAIGSAVTFEDQMEAVRQPITTHTNI